MEKGNPYMNLHDQRTYITNDAQRAREKRIVISEITMCKLEDLGVCVLRAWVRRKRTRSEECMMKSWRLGILYNRQNLEVWI